MHNTLQPIALKRTTKPNVAGAPPGTVDVKADANTMEVEGEAVTATIATVTADRSTLLVPTAAPPAPPAPASAPAPAATATATTGGEEPKDAAATTNGAATSSVAPAPPSAAAPQTSSTQLQVQPPQQQTAYLAHSLSCMWIFDFLSVVIKSVRRVNTRALLGVVGVFCDWCLLHPTILNPPLKDMPAAERESRCGMLCSLSLLVNEIMIFKDLEKVNGMW